METRLILPGCPAYLDRDGSKRCGLPAEVRCRFMLSSAEREAAVKAAAIEVPVTGLPGPGGDQGPDKWTPAPAVARPGR